ncbi:hypothetical protein [Photobacterium salinisoli]|uniref:hypothetical protein n=1 Tax=Photobacterium salinisoli TaxID=1616783 RepID=UPI000EA03E26|nr:hypothetical protein [Photobacterium salinisoli]
MSVTKINVNSATKPVAVTGRFFKVLSASESIQVRFEFEEGDDSTITLYQGLGVEYPTKYRRVWVESDTAQDIVIWAGLGKMTDDRSQTSLVGCSALLNHQANLTANVVAEVAPLRLGRRSLLIQVDQPTYIGGANLDTTNGILVDGPGEIEISTQAAVFALCATDSTVRCMSEVN